MFRYCIDCLDFILCLQCIQVKSMEGHRNLHAKKILSPLWLVLCKRLTSLILNINEQRKRECICRIFIINNFEQFKLSHSTLNCSYFQRCENGYKLSGSRIEGNFLGGWVPLSTEFLIHKHEDWPENKFLHIYMGFLISPITRTVQM